MPRVTTRFNWCTSRDDQWVWEQIWCCVFVEVRCRYLFRILCDPVSIAAVLTVPAYPRGSCLAFPRRRGRLDFWPPSRCLTSIVM